MPITRHRPLPEEVKAKTLCRSLLQGGTTSSGLSTAEAAFALAYAVERGWIDLKPFGLTAAGREIATRSRAGHHRGRLFH